MGVYLNPNFVSFSVELFTIGFTARIYTPTKNQTKGYKFYYRF